MMSRFSAASLLRNAFSGHTNWPQQFRSAEPKSKYQAVIIGGGGHELSAAYHLAKEFGITHVAMIEKGWIGGGNTGRNTAMVRSNYLQQDSVHLHDTAIKMWESMSQELNYNVMFSQRGRDEPFPCSTLGHVTSSYDRPLLERTFAMGLIESGRALMGQNIFARHLDGSSIEVTVCKPVFYDKAEKRAHA